MLTLVLLSGICAFAEETSQYNIIWNSQSQGWEDSMPLSGGVLGLNVWVENNDLMFLIGSPNCLDENGMQTKLGMIRLHITPTAFSKDFRQELNLEKSEISVAGKSKDGGEVTVRLWCDVFHPTIHAEIVSGKPVTVTATYESWSNFDAKFVGGGIQWMRRLAPVNQRRARDIKAQGMSRFEKDIPDPLSNLTEGGRLLAPGLEPAGTGTESYHAIAMKTWSVKTAQPTTTLNLLLPLRMEQDPSPEVWESKLAVAMAAAKDREKSLAWWQDFWDRSYIEINSSRQQTDGWKVGRNYELFRYELAANRDGRTMTLFNGGVFVCSGNPDKRMWGGCQFMAQNQRLVYWPMLRSGDFDLLKVALDFYRDRTEMNRLHAKQFWGVDGLVYNEPFSIFGLDSIGTDADGRSVPGHLHYHYTSGMEFALMMINWGSYTGLHNKDYLAPAEGIISYYDQYYQKIHRTKTGKPLDDKGHLVIYPSDGLECYHGCTNNTDVVAGLTALSRDLLSLSAEQLTPQEISYYRAFQNRIPLFPIKESEGHRYFAAAESWESIFYNGNMDFAPMYAGFPFNIVAIGRPGLDLLDAAWTYATVRPKVQHQNQCWYPSAIDMARLGHGIDAQALVREKFLHPSFRFPAFWVNPGFCQAPDTDHGGCAMIALQEMLMQTDGRRILLAPAWPANWDCHFKLHAPYQTTIEGSIANGKVEVLKVSPPSRREDIEIFAPAGWTGRKE